MPQSALYMIGSAISHYLVPEKLGEGGMGVVYKVSPMATNFDCLPKNPSRSTALST